MKNLKYLSCIFALCIFAFMGIGLIVYVFKPISVQPQQLSARSFTLQPSSASRSSHSLARADLNLSAAEIVQARQKQQLIEMVTLEQIQRDPNFVFKVSDHAQQRYLRYDPSVIETRQIGEQVQFKVPALGIDYQLKIENMQAIDQDIMRWDGRVLEANSLSEASSKGFSVMQSQTDRYSIIQVQSDQGMINVEIKNGLGIISLESEPHQHDVITRPGAMKLTE